MITRPIRSKSNRRRTTPERRAVANGPVLIFPRRTPGTCRLTGTAPCIEYFLMSKIYVGNLPFSADENAVRDLFAQHGTVDSVALIMDRDTGRPRGFGFVEMPRADAARAIQNLNGQDMGGRALKVNEAQDKPRGGGGGGGGQRRW